MDFKKWNKNNSNITFKNGKLKTIIQLFSWICKLRFATKLQLFLVVCEQQNIYFTGNLTLFWVPFRTIISMTLIAGVCHAIVSSSILSSSMDFQTTIIDNILNKGSYILLLTWRVETLDLLSPIWHLVD